MSKLGGKIIAAFATFVAVLTYLAIGAAIFQAIEQDHEIDQREAYDRELSKLLDKVRYGVEQATRQGEGVEQATRQGEIRS